MRLDPSAQAAGARLFVHQELPSTNAEALRLARLGDTGLVWIVARIQHAGRGRRGRDWVSPPGNLYATLLLRNPSAPALAPQLAFVTALAAADAVVLCAPALAPDIAVKWPNDLLLAGRKAAGILIEAEGDAVAIGIGVNCISHPETASYPATDLTAAGGAVRADDLFAALSATMAARLSEWNRGANFAAIRNDWLARAAGLGTEIVVRLPDRETTGRFESLDPHGRILLAQPGGTVETISAGDVFGLDRPVRMGER